MSLNTASGQSSLRDTLDVIFRHKFKIVGFTIVFVAAVVLYNFLVAEIYRSEARVLIRRGRENMSVDPSVEGTSVALVQSRESQVYSELAILNSRQLAEKVVESIGAEAFLYRPDEAVSFAESASQQGLRATRRAIRKKNNGWRSILVRLDLAPELTLQERAVEKFMDSLDVQVERKSNIIIASFEAQDPAVAHAALDQLIGLYKDRHIKVHASKVDPGFFEDQMNDLEVVLAAAEERLAGFREEHGISSLEKETEILLDHLQQLKSRIDEASAGMSASRAQANALEKTINGQDATVELSRITGTTNWAADDYKKRLADLRLKEADLAARYAGTYRPLVELRRQIKQIDDVLSSEGDTRTEITTGINENRRQLELERQRHQAEYDAQAARLEVLSTSLVASEDRHHALAATKVALARLEREVALAEEEYRKYRNKLEESKISVALDTKEVSNVSMVQAATKPLAPVRPRKVRNMALGLLFGLFGGIALAFCLDYIDDSFKKDGDVEKRLALPVLASISEKEFRSCI